MRVLFLALGANRRLAVIEESRRLAGAGELAVVLVDDRRAWSAETFAPGVTVLSLREQAAGHWPASTEQLVLFRVPKALLRRVGGRRGGRLASAYERRVAERLHRRAFLPLYRRLWRDGADRPLEAFRRRQGRFDAIVVTDPQSLPAAQRLVGPAGRADAPRVAFRVDQLLAPAAPGNGMNHKDRA
jgi:hypothetical protein